MGPLVLAGVLFREEQETVEALEHVGVGSVRRLSPTRRAEVMQTIRKTRSKQLVYRIEPQVIDEADSVNAVEIAYSARLINKLRPHKVFIDAPVSEKMFEEYKGAVKRTTFRSPRIRKEDDVFAQAVMAAAKVVAREVHAAEMERIKKRYGDVGSGYPADKKTKQWLKKWKRENKEWPDIVRTSWATVQKI